MHRSYRNTSEPIAIVLYEEKKRNLPLCGDYGELTDRLDIQLSLLLIDIHWQNIFSSDLPRSSSPARERNCKATCELMPGCRRSPTSHE